MLVGFPGYLTRKHTSLSTAKDQPQKKEEIACWLLSEPYRCDTKAH